MSKASKASKASKGTTIFNEFHFFVWGGWVRFHLILITRRGDVTLQSVLSSKTSKGTIIIYVSKGTAIYGSKASKGSTIWGRDLAVGLD